MGWALWLSMPVGTTALASLAVWWRSRPDRVPSARRAMRAHRDYLDALVVPARGTARAASGPEPRASAAVCD